MASCGRSSPSSDDYYDYDVDKLDVANGHTLDIRDPTTAAPGVAHKPQPQSLPPRQSAAASSDSLKKRELDLLTALLAVEEKRLALEMARFELDRRKYGAMAKYLMQLQEISAEILLALMGGGNLARNWQANSNEASLYE
ncbi:hypothetical protein HK405_000358, partial [Cladochytrium tenue]